MNCDFFFFQAEDGIRDGRVTGVQTCALPIYLPRETLGGTVQSGKSFLSSAGDAKRLVDQRFDGSERTLTLARQLRKLGNDLGEWWGRRIDRQQALLDHDERQVERAGLARLWVPLEFEPVENRLGFVSRLLNGTGDVLVGDAHAGAIYTPTSQERGYVHCCDGIGERLYHSTHHTRGTGRNASTSMMPFQGAPSALVKSVAQLVRDADRRDGHHSSRSGSSEDCEESGEHPTHDEVLGEPERADPRW